jgi:Tol biopolymer transport system component
MKTRLQLLSGLAAALLLGSLANSAPSGGGTNGATQRISLNSAGLEIANISRNASISRDGRFVAFECDGSLLPFDLNGRTDIYVYDRQTGVLQVASRVHLGPVGNNDSSRPAISGDGRFVAFTTEATNLVGNDTNGASDVLVKDLQTGALVRASAPIGSLFPANGDSLSASLSFDGRYVAFQSIATDLHAQGANGFYDVYVRDLVGNTINCASRGAFGPANGSSYSPSIAADGSAVAFHTYASNSTLNDFNDHSDVVVRNLVQGGIARVSVGQNSVGGNGPSYSASISDDGRYVAFSSEATNLVAGDTNGVADVFRRDRTLDTTEIVSLALGGGLSSGAASYPSISADGNTIAFVSSAQDLIAAPAAFLSVYVRNIELASTYLASRSSGPVLLPNSSSTYPALSGDGSVVAFGSGATNLTQGDTNGQFDVFVRTMIPDPIAYCAPSVTSAGCTPQLNSSGLPRASQNSGFVVTCDNAPNNKSGLLFYGLSGRLNTPFLAGTMCVELPVVRTPTAFSGGNPVSVDDCSGAFQIDMNAFAKGLLGVAPMPALAQVGTQVNVQYWGRDPQGASASTFLSDALEYVVGP